MLEDWYPRFAKAIKDDGRVMKEISEAAGCGPNYVQQILKDGKRPGVDRFVRILQVLGPGPAMFILTGHEKTSEDDEFILAVASLDPQLKAEARRFLRVLQDRLDNPKPSDADPPGAGATGRT